MSKNYYPQDITRPSTLTVGELIERLRSFDPDAPVIFKSPSSGSFGPGVTYSVDRLQPLHLEREEKRWPAQMVTDDETGEEYEEPAWTEVKHEWEGVVIA